MVGLVLIVTLSFSALDGMQGIDAMVEKAASLGQPALGLTDHGYMSGTFSLYKACRTHDIKPFPGFEAYFVEDIHDKDAPRHHLTLLAYSTEGYQSLVKLSTISHQRDGHFHRKPRFDWADLAAMAAERATEGIVCMSGCYFGPVQQAFVRGAPDAAKRIAMALQRIFPTFFVEIQHHHTDHGDEWTDTKMAMALYDLAGELSLPIMVTQDCHYLHKSHGELHTLMKGVSYGAEPGDVGFPGDSYHLASSSWVQRHYEGTPIWTEALLGAKHLLDLHTFTLPPLDRYQYVVPQVLDQPASLTELCWEAMADKSPWKSNPDHNLASYTERLKYELGVIKGLAMDDYFLLVHDYVSWAEANGILVMARGSATGSLVCWLLGFTQADPLQWRLTFDRFLTPDRVRPPDIDLDIEDTRRGDVIDYLAEKYDLTQIGTFNRMGFDEETGRGSVFVKYIGGQRKLLGDDFARKLGRVKDVYDLAKVDPSTAGNLVELAKQPLRTSAGAHAAGFVLSQEGLRVTDWIPTMLIASSDTTVTQMMMDDVEDAGFVKIDLLGLRSLSTMAHALKLLGKPAGDLSWIPLDDKETMKMLRKGKPGTGIFQLEGYTAAKGCKEFKPKTVADLILINALYRPATIDHGYTADFITNRADSSLVTYPHAIFEKHLRETHGVPVFQEQVLAILRDLGMPVEKLNDFLTAVKGKHAIGGYSDKSDALVAGARVDFDRLCKSHGMVENEIEKAWSLVEGFAAYGFNRAHATAYALFGYQLAYLKVHHKLEFHTALLATTTGPKMKDYMAEARRVGIRLLSPDVNISGVNWTLDHDKGAIRRGLSSVLGPKAAQALVEAQPYTSVEDIIERTPARVVTGGKKWSSKGELVGVLAKLRDSRALSSLGVMPQ